MPAIKIYFDNVDVLTEHGVFLMGSKGLLEPLRFKTPYQHDWDDEHGIDIDASEMYFEERRITLDLGIKQTTKALFKNEIFAFWDQVLNQNRLVQMRIDEHTKVNMVRCVGHKAFEKLIFWNNTLNVGKFKLDFIDPVPVNRQYKNTFTTLQSNVSVDCPTADEDEVFDVFWGDGTKTTVSESGGSVTSAYGSAGTYYIVVAGRMDKITTLTVTNSTEQTW